MHSCVLCYLSSNQDLKHPNCTALQFFKETVATVPFIIGLFDTCSPSTNSLSCTELTLSWQEC